jgi:hypothetical protein
MELSICLFKIINQLLEACYVQNSFFSSVVPFVFRYGL